MDRSLWKKCHICGKEPPQHVEEHCRHYGAISCNNCKAFFKYCHNNGLVKDGQVSYKCVRNSPGTCNVSCDLRPKEVCQECRYLKCVKAGMDGPKVLTGDQKKKYDHSQVRKSSGTVKTKAISGAYQKAHMKVFEDEEAMHVLLHGHCWGIAWTPKHTEALLKLLDKQAECLVYMMSELPEVPTDDLNVSERKASLFKYYIMARYFMASQGGRSQIDWILGPKTEQLMEANNNPMLREVSLYEINQWNSLFPVANMASCTLFCEAMEAIEKHFACKQEFIPLIGYNLAIYNEQCPDKVEFVPIQDYQFYLLQVDFLRHLLVSLKSLIEQDFSSKAKFHTFLTKVDTKWIEISIARNRRIYQENQIDSDTIAALIAIGQTGCYERFHIKQSDMVNVFKHRFELFLAPYKINLSLLQVGKVMSFIHIQAASFDNIYDMIQWAMGNGFEQPDNVPQDLTTFPNLNVYDAFQCMGVFIHKKKEALEFKKVVEKLLHFARIKYVADLFLFTLLFDEEDGKQHQLEYRTILARKLLDHTEELEVENGNEAMCQLECLFASYLALSKRMTWIPRRY